MFARNWWNRLTALFSREQYHRFHCMNASGPNADCPGPGDVLVPDQFKRKAERTGCDWCGETLRPHGQGTAVACPTCPAELVSQPDNVQTNNTDAGLVVYECTQCGTTSKWDFAPPTPILLTHNGVEPLAPSDFEDNDHD